MLKVLREAKLLVNPTKSEFKKEEVYYLGYVVSVGKIQIEDSKVSVVKD